MKKLPLSIGILSWKGYKSLENSLLSYKINGLNHLVSKKYICLPEYNEKGVFLSKKFGYKPILFEKNLGILNGFKELAKKMPDGPLLLLENDLPLIKNEKETFEQLNQSIKFLYSNNVAQVRLRSRKNPGTPFHAIAKYNRYWDNTFLSGVRKFLRPYKAKRLIGTSVYVKDKPHLQHPNYISHLENGFYSVSSQVLNWSNLAILVDKKFFLNVIIKQAENTYSSKTVNGFKNIEIELNKPWWRKQSWRIVLAPGIFTHKRLSDRGY